VIEGIIIGVLLLISNFVGINIGYRLKIGEKPIPTIKEAVDEGIINPIKEIQSEIEQNKEVTKLKTLLHNIDVYDGTSSGQKKVK
jgi:hypothetical protein